jgi:sugar O-acyltransferase (sialic acid O-acetyltransferase NeuD family)
VPFAYMRRCSERAGSAHRRHRQPAPTVRIRRRGRGVANGRSAEIPSGVEDVAGMRTQRLLIGGASGHARVVADIARRMGSFEITGICNRSGAGEFEGIPVIARDVDVPELWRLKAFDLAFMAIGDNWDRAHAVQLISSEEPDIVFATLIHPRAVVADSANVGEGTVIMAGATINPGAMIGRHTVLNTNCSVDHDCQICDFASVSPGAALGGNVKLGYCSFVGIGAAVSQGISMGDHTVVGAGAVVVRDLGDRLVAMGVPAREVRTRKPDERYL